MGERDGQTRVTIVLPGRVWLLQTCRHDNKLKFPAPSWINYFFYIWCLSRTAVFQSGGKNIKTRSLYTVGDLRGMPSLFGSKMTKISSLVNPPCPQCPHKNTSGWVPTQRPIAGVVNHLTWHNLAHQICEFQQASGLIVMRQMHTKRKWTKRQQLKK